MSVDNNEVDDEYENDSIKKIKFNEDYEAHYKVLSTASHEIMNYLSTIGSTYQYLDTRYPETKGFKFWNNLGTSVNYLCYFMKQTSLCRYSHFPKKENTTSDALTDLVYDGLGECQYTDIIEYLFISSGGTNHNICCDCDNVSAAVCQLIINAYEAITDNDKSNDSSSDIIPENADSERAIRVNIATQGDYLKISVTNHGCLDGQYSSEQLAAPFFTTRSNHAGCGLYIANIVCTAHGGYLTIESHDNLTTATLALSSH